MGDPFVGFVRNPATVTDATPEDVQAAITSASAKYGVPESILQRVFGVESAGQANPYQEVGFNSSGFGGFFGLSKDSLGTAQQQADTSASILASAYAQAGDWEDALSIYRTGKPGQGYPGGAGAAPSPAAASSAPSVALPQGAVYLAFVAALVFFVMVVV